MLTTLTMFGCAWGGHASAAVKAEEAAVGIAVLGSVSTSVGGSIVSTAFGRRQPMEFFPRFEYNDFVEQWDVLKEQAAKGEGPWLNIMNDGLLLSEAHGARLITMMRRPGHFQHVFQADKAKGWAALLALASTVTIEEAAADAGTETEAGSRTAD